MSVNLQKGQKVDLTKGNAGLKKIVVGLGWDEAQPEQGKGLFGSLFSGQKQDIDCDASAILCDANGKYMDKNDIVFYNNLHHASGCVNHMGDNLTGGGEGDDEQITVDLLDLPEKYQKITFVVTIYKARERRQHFGMIRNAFIRIVDASTRHELFRYNLSENYDGMTSMIFGEVYRMSGEWKFSAVGQGTSDDGIAEIAKRFR
jgi:Uncharacterized proteins involved in stress response, homologs of TerZ and putative cAMP-binding protein CABP1